MIVYDVFVEAIVDEATKHVRASLESPRNSARKPTERVCERLQPWEELRQKNSSK